MGAPEGLLQDGWAVMTPTLRGKSRVGVGSARINAKDPLQSPQHGRASRHRRKRVPVAKCLLVTELERLQVSSDAPASSAEGRIV